MASVGLARVGGQREQVRPQRTKLPLPLFWYRRIFRPKADRGLPYSEELRQLAVEPEPKRLSNVSFGQFHGPAV